MTFCNRAFLDDPAGLHHVDPVSQLPHDGQIVRDEQIADQELFLQLPEQLQNLRLHGNVESRHGFIKHYELRPDSESARDSNALALTSGKCRRLASRVMPSKADLVEQFDQSFLATAGMRSMQRQYFAQGGADRERRIQGGVRVLKYDLYRGPDPTAFRHR